MSAPDRTPDGDPIHVETLWLDFPEGDIAISADLTRFDAAMRRLRETLRRDGTTAPPDPS
jgi:hypothetical protein